MAAVDNSVDTARLREALALLRAPFAPDAVKWKVQTKAKDESGAMVVAYIDSRLVVDRLNHVVGGDWFDEYEPVLGRSRDGQVIQRGLECRLTVLGVQRRDVGTAADDAAGGPKALYSDALKRTAVKFGVGASIYMLPKVWLKGDALRRGRDNKIAGIADGAQKRLQAQYDGWLQAIGIEKFGEVIDHGDHPIELDTGQAYVPAGVDDEQELETPESAPTVGTRTRGLTPHAIPQGERRGDPRADEAPPSAEPVPAPEPAAAPEPDPAPTPAAEGPPPVAEAEVPKELVEWLRLETGDSLGLLYDSLEKIGHKPARRTRPAVAAELVRAVGVASVHTREEAARAIMQILEEQRRVRAAAEERRKAQLAEETATPEHAAAVERFEADVIGQADTGSDAARERFEQQRAAQQRQQAEWADAPRTDPTARPIVTDGQETLGGMPAEKSPPWTPEAGA
jgi:antitoxin component of MazEF toxin-antitoxin module